MLDRIRPGAGNTPPQHGGKRPVADLRKRGRNLLRLPIGSRRSGRFPYSAAGIVLGLAVWEAGVRLGDIPHYVLPPLTEVLRTAVEESGYLLAETWVTFQEIVAGFLLSVIVGISLAFLIVSVRTIGKSIYPILVISQVIPKIVFAPVFLVLFGFGMTSKILIAFLLSFFPIVIDTVLGLRSTSVEALHFARSTGAGSMRTLLLIRFPNALPQMFAGLKLAATFSVTGAVLSEFIGADQGLGRAMLKASAGRETDVVFAGVLYISAVGFGMFLLMQYLESVVAYWHVSQRRRRALAG